MLNNMNDKLLTPKEASTYLGVKENSLAVWRLTKRYNLQFIKIGRLVKYRKSDLDSWIESRTVKGA